MTLSLVLRQVEQEGREGGGGKERGREGWTELVVGCKGSVEQEGREGGGGYKDAPVDVRRIAEDLSVRYVLEGSLQSFGDQVRVNAQLIDAVSGQTVWSKRFDSSRSDFFALRDEITYDIIAELDRELLQGGCRWDQGTRPVPNIIFSSSLPYHFFSLTYPPRIFFPFPYFLTYPTCQFIFHKSD